MQPPALSGHKKPVLSPTVLGRFHCSLLSVIIQYSPIFPNKVGVVYVVSVESHKFLLGSEKGSIESLVQYSIIAS